MWGVLADRRNADGALTSHEKMSCTRYLFRAIALVLTWLKLKPGESSLLISAPQLQRHFLGMLLELEELPAVTTVLIVVPLQPPMNCLAEVQGNLGPSPPEHAQYEIDGGEAHQHVMTEKKSLEKENNEADRNKRKNQARNKRKKKK